MKWVLYTIAFLVEIAAWCATAGLAFLALSGGAAWVVAVLIFLVVVTLWGLFMAPKARYPLPMLVYYLVKGVFYAGAAVVLWYWQPAAGVAFVVAVLVSEPALALRRREEFAANG